MLRFLAAALVVCLCSLPAAAEPICGDRTAILESLAHEFQEVPAAMGVSNGGEVIEVFTARHGRTWTILVTHRDGNSCIVAAGEQWTPVPQQLSATVDDGI
jgi:hypothetical protein